MKTCCAVMVLLLALRPVQMMMNVVITTRAGRPEATILKIISSVLMGKSSTSPRMPNLVVLQTSITEKLRSVVGRPSMILAKVTMTVVMINLTTVRLSSAAIMRSATYLQKKEGRYLC